MASETSASAVLNERCDVNSGIQSVCEPIREHVTRIESYDVTYDSIKEEKTRNRCNSESRSVKTPNGTPTVFTKASSSASLPKTLGRLSCGDEDRDTGKSHVVNSHLHILPRESRGMSHYSHTKDANRTASLPRELEGNFELFYPIVYLVAQELKVFEFFIYRSGRRSTTYCRLYTSLRCVVMETRVASQDRRNLKKIKFFIHHV